MKKDYKQGDEFFIALGRKLVIDEVILPKGRIRTNRYQITVYERDGSVYISRTVSEERLGQWIALK